MSKRSIEESIAPASKKMKATTQEESTSLIQSIPEDVWSQKIFAFLNGNDLFTNQRLVCSSWNTRVLATRCALKVSLADDDQDSIFIACGEGGSFKNIVALSITSTMKPSSFEKIVKLDWQSLRSLDLRDCNIGEEGVKQLVNGNMKGLISLDLSNNNIGSVGIEYLSKGNITGLTSLKIFNNNIGEEGAKYLLTGNLRGLTTLNYQTLASKGENKFFAMTDHFCGDTPFTVHSFDNSDDFTEYIFRYYLDYWKHYGSHTLDLGDDEQDDDEEPNEPLLREKVYALTFGKIADMATEEVGGMVFNECEREGIIATVYGQELTKELWSSSDESTPFVIVEKSDGCEFLKTQVIGKSKFLEKIKTLMNDDGDEEAEDEEEEEEEENEEKSNKKDDFEKIMKKIAENISSGDIEGGILSVCIGEIIAAEFVLLK